MAIVNFSKQIDINIPSVVGGKRTSGHLRPREIQFRARTLSDLDLYWSQRVRKVFKKLLMKCTCEIEILIAWMRR